MGELAAVVDERIDAAVGERERGQLVNRCARETADGRSTEVMRRAA